MPNLPAWWPQKIVSGGQTGVDRAALAWALRNGVEHGGWCPAGRLAADGRIPDHYNLTETESTGYRQRTKLNVRDSDATLILNAGPLSGGTELTARFAQQMGKPFLVVQIDEVDRPEAGRRIAAWLQDQRPAVLNVAGPREEKSPGVYESTLQVFDACASLDFGFNLP